MADLKGRTLGVLANVQESVQNRGGVKLSRKVVITGLVAVVMIASYVALIWMLLNYGSDILLPAALLGTALAIPTGLWFWQQIQALRTPESDSVALVSADECDDDVVSFDEDEFFKALNEWDSDEKQRNQVEVFWTDEQRSEYSAMWTRANSGASPKVSAFEDHNMRQWMMVAPVTAIFAVLGMFSLTGIDNSPISLAAVTGEEEAVAQNGSEKSRDTFIAAGLDGNPHTAVPVAASGLPAQPAGVPNRAEGLLAKLRNLSAQATMNSAGVTRTLPVNTPAPGQSAVAPRPESAIPGAVPLHAPAPGEVPPPAPGGEPAPAPAPAPGEVPPPAPAPAPADVPPPPSTSSEPVPSSPPVADRPILDPGESTTTPAPSEPSETTAPEETETPQEKCELDEDGKPLEGEAKEECLKKREEEKAKLRETEMPSAVEPQP